MELSFIFQNSDYEKSTAYFCMREFYILWLQLFIQVAVQIQLNIQCAANRAVSTKTFRGKYKSQQAFLSVPVGNLWLSLGFFFENVFQPFCWKKFGLMIIRLCLEKSLAATSHFKAENNENFPLRRVYFFIHWQNSGHMHRKILDIPSAQAPLVQKPGYAVHNLLSENSNYWWWAVSTNRTIRIPCLHPIPPLLPPAEIRNPCSGSRTLVLSWKGKHKVTKWWEKVHGILGLLVWSATQC